MSSEMQDNNTQQQPEGADLSSALASGDSEFVPIEEPKSAVSQGMLYLLALIVIGGGGTYLMYKKQSPANASAASVETQQAQQTINTFLTNGPTGIKMMEEMLHNTEKIVKQFLEYPSVPQIPLSELHTNPFRFAKGEPGSTADGDAAKLKKDEERSAAMKASQNLNLQSIIHSGSRKACMINNTLFQEGQQVEQFVIEKISPSAVIVKTGAYRFELRMQK
jgi:hypothetical protein